MKALFAIAGAVVVLSWSAGPVLAQKKPASCTELCQQRVGNDGKRYGVCMSKCQAQNPRQKKQ